MGGSGSVAKDLAREPEGRWFKSQPAQKIGVEVEDVPFLLQSTVEMPLSKAPTSQQLWVR